MASWQGLRAVLCFGDSLTRGMTSRGEYSPYSDQLEQRLRQFAAPPVVVNAGVSGQTTRGMLSRLPGLLRKGAEPQLKFDVVVILGGTNDLRSLDVGEIVDNLVELHSMAHAAGAITGVLTLPEYGRGGSDVQKKWAQVNQALRGYAARNPSTTFLVDVANAIPQDSAHSALWDSDRVHLSRNGYQALGDLVADARLPVRAPAVPAPVGLGPGYAAPAQMPQGPPTWAPVTAAPTTPATSPAVQTGSQAPTPARRARSKSLSRRITNWARRR